MISDQIREEDMPDYTFSMNVINNQARYTQQSGLAEPSLYENGLSIPSPDATLPLSPLFDLLPGDEATQVLNEMDLKPLTGGTLPSLEEHDEGLSFQLKFNPQSKNGWYFSSRLKKVFVKINTVFYIDVIYSPRNWMEKMHLRATPVYSEEISQPVVRCANHISTDPFFKKQPIPDMVYHILRSQNSDVEYLGNCTSNAVNDRFSILIPLLQTKCDNNCVKQSIALKFVCQNSCIGRKQTAIIFQLENARSEDLAKRVLKIKVCSCPKRDMEKEEKDANLKRESSELDIPVGKKIRKKEIKLEPQETQVQLTSPLIQKFEFIAPDIDTMIHIVTCAYDRFVGLRELSGNAELTTYVEYYKEKLVQLTESKSCLN